MAMLRKDTRFEIHHLNEPKLLKVITLDEFIEQGLAVCAGSADFGVVGGPATTDDRLRQLLGRPGKEGVEHDPVNAHSVADHAGARFSKEDCRGPHYGWNQRLKIKGELACKMYD